MHLIIDGFGSNPKLLESEDLLYQLLDDYPAQIGMTKVAPPHVFRYVGSKPEDISASTPSLKEVMSTSTYSRARTLTPSRRSKTFKPSLN
jgi:hypothetical protein